jgi:hypothetical protein
MPSMQDVKATDANVLEEANADVREHATTLSSQYASPFKGGGEDEHGTYAEEAIIWGEARDTPELHDVRCQDQHHCRCISDGKWCFKPTDLEVKTPNARWVFVKEAPVQIQPTRDNDGSAAWNALGAGDRFFVTTRNPTEIRATALTSSRSIAIRIGCLARFYP